MSHNIIPQKMMAGVELPTMKEMTMKPMRENTALTMASMMALESSFPARSYCGDFWKARLSRLYKLAR